MAYLFSPFFEVFMFDEMLTQYTHCQWWWLSRLSIKG